MNALSPEPRKPKFSGILPHDAIKTPLLLELIPPGKYLTKLKRKWFSLVTFAFGLAVDNRKHPPDECVIASAGHGAQQRVLV